jgi:TIR domain
VVRAVPHLRPFFLSYAHAGADSNKAAKRFYNELRGDLQTLVGLPVGTEMGFFDSEGLGPAVLWPQELAAALGSCQVLVSLLSVPYLNSEWCGKEWHAFTLRERQPRPGASRFQNQGSIIPVRWAPIPFDLPPEVQGKVQIFAPQSTPHQPDLPELYEKEGVFGLLRTNQEEAFGRTIWDLAKSIQQIYYSQLLKPRDLDPDELRNVFEGGLP